MILFQSTRSNLVATWLLGGCATKWHYLLTRL